MLIDRWGMQGRSLPEDFLQRQREHGGQEVWEGSPPGGRSVGVCELSDYLLIVENRP
jgi:hypothetical protein